MPEEILRSATIVVTPSGSGHDPHTVRILFSPGGHLLDADAPRPALFTEVQLDIEYSSENNRQPSVFLFNFRRTGMGMERMDDNNHHIHVIVYLNENGVQQQAITRKVYPPRTR